MICMLFDISDSLEPRLGSWWVPGQEIISFACQASATQAFSGQSRPAVDWRRPHQRSLPEPFTEWAVRRRQSGRGLCDDQNSGPRGRGWVGHEPLVCTWWLLLCGLVYRLFISNKTHWGDTIILQPGLNAKYFILCKSDLGLMFSVQSRLLSKQPNWCWFNSKFLQFNIGTR